MFTQFYLKNSNEKKKECFWLVVIFFSPFRIFILYFFPILFIGNTKIVERKYISLCVYIVCSFLYKNTLFLFRVPQCKKKNEKKKLHLTRVLWYSVFNNLLLFDVVVFSVFTQHIILCYIQLNNAIVCNRIEKAGSSF